MKLCVIGNSHVACVKKAYDLTGPDELGFTIDFFASTGDSICNTKMVDGALVPTHDLVKDSWLVASGGKGSVRLKDYKAVLIHGLTPPLSKLASYATSLNVDSFYSDNFKAKAILAVDHKLNHLIQIGAFEACDNVIVTSRPNVAANSKNKADLQGFHEIEASIGNLLWLSGLNYIAQPFETLITLNTTESKFASGGLGLGDRVTQAGFKLSKPKNRTHMNAEYGTCYLNAIKKHLNNKF